MGSKSPRRGILIQKITQAPLYYTPYKVYNLYIDGRALLKLLEKNGWHLDRVKGSHHIMKKGKQIIILPIHGKTDLKPGMLNSLMKKAGLK